MHQCIEGIVTSDELSYLRSLFVNGEHNTCHHMDKVGIPYNDRQFMAFVENLIRIRLQISKPYQLCGDNFYKHSYSYFPHCDAVEKEAWLNIVIPIEVIEPVGTQKFIVFDQHWCGMNATWVGNFEMPGDFVSNKKTSQRPCDSLLLIDPVKSDLPEEIWSEMDHTYFTRDYLYGLTGKAYNWVPGDVLVFDSHHIHATGKMMCDSKLGLSLRLVHI